MTAPAFDPAPLRAQFPALALEAAGRPAVYFDSPGGTQVPACVIEAVSRCYREQNANIGGAFETSRRAGAVVQAGREAMADLLNAPDPDTIVFGPNMTTLAFHLARSLGDTIRPGDEIVVTNLDHDANVAPWTDLAARGAVIRTVDIEPATCQITPGAVQAALSDRTRLVAVTHASNAVGVIPDVREIIRRVRAAAPAAMVFVDAVQYAPHGSIDVQELDCDFLACSAYKFFGPHLGVLYGKRERLEALPAHKVRPAPDTIPWLWETGTQNHEGIAGTDAAVNYLAGIGERFGGPWERECAATFGPGRGGAVHAGMRAIAEYERGLCARLLAGLRSLPDVRIYGPSEPGDGTPRVPTVAFTWPRMTPRATAEYLAERGVFCWSGHYYAVRLMERLGLEPGGSVRIGLTHYNTAEEVDRLLEALGEAG